MGDTRIDGSTPRTTPECDEDTGVCDAVKKPDPQVSVDYVYDDQSHVVPDPKPAHLAEIAKNMSTPKPPTDTTADEGLKTQSSAHIGYTQDRDGVEAHATLHKTDNVTVLDVGVEVSEQELGPHATVLHGKHTWTIKGVDLSLSGDAGSVECGPGIHNADGSTGLHLGGNATSIGGEATIHKQGIGSVTGGVSEGVSAEASVGVKKEGDTMELCGRVSWAIVTVGVCFPVPGRY